VPKPVVVVNRPGGAGTIGMTEIVQARPDGHTVGLSAVAVATVQPHLTALPYRTPDDYVAIMKLVTLQVVLFVRAGAPWRTARELLDHARAHPGKVRVGVPGIGTILHLDLEQLKRSADVDVTVVPFEGPQQIAALLGSHVDVALAHPAPVLPHVRAGTIRVIGVFQAGRNPLFAEAPTFRELGHDITLGVYYFLVAPRGTPPAAVATLHEAFRKALVEPAFVTLAERGQIDIDYQGPEAIKRELATSFERLGALVEQLGLKKK
jgi:tripartite-type tricarboxylate transporter receptor subunit TctC